METKPLVPPASVFAWLGVIGIPTTLALAFVWTAGGLTPQRLTQNTLLSALSKVDGVHPGFRRNHAKGICVTGWFESNGNAAKFSSSAMLEKNKSKVIGRLALAGGMPFQADAPGKVRSMALRMISSDGEEWRMGMNDIPVFPVRTPQEFQDLQLASAPNPATGRPDPLRVIGFRANHPWLQAAAERISHRSISSGFSDDTYRSLNSFLLVSKDGSKTAVRWTMVPTRVVTSAAPNADAHNSLFERLITEIHASPLQWHMIVTIAGKQDVINDPTQGWSDHDEKVDAGTLTLENVESEEHGPCTGITFDPTILPGGVNVSDDPILAARSASYMRSFYLRSREKRPLPAITDVMTDSQVSGKGKKS
ncbi:catalase family peroxidase [Gluconobacter albidus]|uniref:catalase family peroxidase n=1 Tax=Gluconobacter albidus TaxID=318683 RepID=UPI0030A6391C